MRVDGDDIDIPDCREHAGPITYSMRRLLRCVGATPNREPAHAVPKAAQEAIALGRKHTQASDFEAAIRAFSDAIARDPLAARAWSGRGFARLRACLAEHAACDADRAQADFERALELEPGDGAEARKFRAQVEHNLEQLAPVLAR